VLGWYLRLPKFWWRCPGDKIGMPLVFCTFFFIKNDTLGCAFICKTYSLLFLISGVTTNAHIQDARSGSMLREHHMTRSQWSQHMKENITMNHQLVGATTRMQEYHNRKGRPTYLVIKLHFRDQTSAMLTRCRLGSYNSRASNSNIHFDSVQNLAAQCCLDDVLLANIGYLQFVQSYGITVS